MGSRKTAPAEEETNDIHYRKTHRINTVLHITDSAGIIVSVNIPHGQESDLLRHWRGASTPRRLARPRPRGPASNFSTLAPPIARAILQLLNERHRHPGDDDSVGSRDRLDGNDFTGRSAVDDADSVFEIAGRWLCYRSRFR
jgi:hypothetical protein